MQTFLPDASTLRGWQRSQRCDNSGPNCVEAAPHPVGVAVRNSNNPAGPALLFTPEEWNDFIGGAKDGNFDGLTV